MIKLYKLFSWCVVSIFPAISFAGQIAVVNPGAASGVAIVMAPVVVAAPTVTAPTVSTPTVTTPTVAAPTVTTPTVAAAAPTATTPISTAPAETAPTTSTGSPTQSESNSGAASSAPISVSGYAPQVVASMQSMNVSTFTPQQVNTLISTIDALISQSGTPTSVRQALISERARLSAIASR